jgi:hypothetical protein
MRIGIDGNGTGAGLGGKRAGEKYDTDESRH